MFLATKFGQYLLEGIDDPEVDKLGITRLSQFIKVMGTYAKALIKSKNELSAMPVLSKIYKENQQVQEHEITTFAPQYLQDLKKLHDSNTFCSS